MSNKNKISNSLVSLVGAGPGDPGLLTVKALKRIREADLIIYDYLVNLEHLCHAKNDAIKIGVGKGFRHHRLSQEKINRLIIQAATKGQSIVRLKGGDPYLFGRGGEEALYLYEHKIPFEVIPGVTSATACAAYSGIPLTHREHNSSVTFLTGHRADDKNLDSVDWRRIAALKGTLVIYMGFYNLGKIAERLMEVGMPADTKVSVIQWGTLSWQKSCDGTLQNIEQIVLKKKMGAPSMIIIGDVVSLKNKLNWFERLPLFGKKIVITRTRDKSSVLKEKLAELGGWVLEMPVIEIKPIQNYSHLDQTIQKIKNFDWIVFTSTYGVDAFFERLQRVHHQDVRTLSGIKVASVGSETSAALREKGLLSDLEPKRFETVAITEEFKKRFKNLKGKKILLLRTNIAPPELEERLKKMGAVVSRVTAYRTLFPKRMQPEVKKELLHGSVDYVMFTSSSTVSNFTKLLGLKNIKNLTKTQFSSIGPVTSKTMKSFGLRVSCEAKIFTIDGLIHSIINHAQKKTD
jgi:uroporphyrinogen III methyltransferase/synthase